MLTKLKLFFLRRDHKNALWSQLLLFETSFRLFRKMDIYKCPKTSFPKKSWEKKHKFAKKTINGKSNLKNRKSLQMLKQKCRKNVAKYFLILPVLQDGLRKMWSEAIYRVYDGLSKTANKKKRLLGDF